MKNIKNILENKLFVKTLIADLISNFGDIVYYIALMTYVTLLPESDKKLAVSLMTILGPIPYVLEFVIGYFGDKTKDKIRNILITLFIRTTLYIVLAFAMGFSPALWIVILAIIINFVSDMTGLYENSMYYKVSKNIVPDKDREKFIAFKISTVNFLEIVFQAIGGVLILLISYQSLAFVNAVSFLLAAIILASIKTPLRKIISRNFETKPAENKRIGVEKNKKLTIKEVLEEQKDAFNSWVSIPEIKICVIIWPLINPLASMVTKLLVLMLGIHSSMMIVSSAFTITSVQVMYSIGALIGGYISIKYLKKISITTLTRIETLSTLILFILIYYHQIYFMLISILLITIVAISSQSKFDTITMNKCDENKLGVIFGGMNTYFTIGDLIFGIIFGILINLVSLNTIILIAISMSSLLAVYACFIYKDPENEKIKLESENK